MTNSKSNRGNYRKGGLIMLPFVAIGLITAYLLNAPIQALLSISIFGFGCSLILIIIGDRRKIKS